MTNGLIEDKESKIAKRIFIISNLEEIIKESIYYRTHSAALASDIRISIGSINNREIKKKIL